MKEVRVVSVAVAGLLVLTVGSSRATLVATNVYETWEGQPRHSPFSGTGNVPWVGDVANFDLTSATWPPSPANQNFAGTNSLRHALTTASTSAVFTAFSFVPDRPTTWSVFVSGLAAAEITTGRDFDFILMSDTSSTAAITAGAVNGYRLRVGTRTGTIDSLMLERATGSGWTTLSFFDLGFDANAGQGWNLMVFRETGGSWYYGVTTGAVGSAVSLSNLIVDNSVLTSSFAGMRYRSSATSANGFGFDNFLITSVPEPSAAMIVVLGAGLLALRRLRRG